MAAGRFRFADFVLDPAERSLRRGETKVDLNARYLDALALLVRDAGRLVTKDRFMDEVWRGVPVTDEALTQCIRMLRRQLGDDVAAPRFIETVPKHGYRFVAPVAVEGKISSDAEDMAAEAPLRRSAPSRAWLPVLQLGAAGTIGAGLSGLIGGLIYGFGGAAQPLAPGMGAASVLLVLVSLSIAVALIGGAGVAFGIAAAGLASRDSWTWPILGGAAGGLVVGAAVKLLGLDAFTLLFGQSPGDITGAAEGALLGAGVGLGARAAMGSAGVRSLGRGVALAAAAGGAAGLAITLLGGRLMAGSLALVADRFPSSQLRLDQIGALFGETGFGPRSALATGVLEGALFAAGIVVAMMLTRRGVTG